MPRRPGSEASICAPVLPVVHLARDYPAPIVAAQARNGRWVKVRHGAYVDAPHDMDDHARLLLLARARLVALAQQLTAPAVVSNESAALLWGLPLLRAPATAHVVVRTKPAARASDVVRHTRALPETHRTTRLGFPITSLERTVVDCAMSLDAREGLVIADAALHAGVSREACLALLDEMAGRRGAAVARAVLDLADDGAESPGESSARFVLLRAGLPVPQTQVPVETHLGTYWSDLGWPGWRLLAEYDGRAKYEANGAASSAVLAEKRRQDSIEEVGYRVLRITNDDVRSPDRLVARIVRAAPAGALGRLRPRGTLGVGPPRPTS